MALIWFSFFILRSAFIRKLSNFCLDCKIKPSLLHFRLFAISSAYFTGADDGGNDEKEKKREKLSLNSFVSINFIPSHMALFSHHIQQQLKQNKRFSCVGNVHVLSNYGQPKMINCAGR